MGEWLKTSLQEVAQINPVESISKGTKAKKVAMEYVLPFTKKVSAFSLEEYKGGAKFRNGDTLVARITPSLENGKTSFVDFLDEKEIGFGSTEFIVLREIEDISDKEFLYYFACSPTFREVAIASMTGSSGRQRVQTDVVKEFLFFLPPLPEQRAIGGVLSALDDKIDLLHRQIVTLEAFSQTLFRQWFVEEAEDDWEEGILSDIAQHKKENIKPDKSPEAYFYHYSIPAFDGGKFPLNEKGTDIKSNKYQVFPNSILISKLNPRFPRVWAIHDEIPENSICSTEFQVIFPKKPDIYSFIYCFLKSSQVTNELIGAASGTSGSHQRVKPHVIFNLKYQVKDQQQISDFHFLVSDNWRKITNNQEQIRTLEKLRDTLLPKLVSGEVRVSMEE